MRMQYLVVVHIYTPDWRMKIAEFFLVYSRQPAIQAARQFFVSMSGILTSSITSREFSLAGLQNNLDAMPPPGCRVLRAFGQMGRIANAGALLPRQP